MVLAEALSKTMPRKPVKKPCNTGPTNTFVVSSPIGTIEILSCPRGLHSVGQQKGHDFFPDTSLEVCLLEQMWPDNGYSYKPALQCIEWLTEYFKDPLKETVPFPALCSSIISQNGSFQEQVWHNLQNKVHAGHTISYGGLATLSNNTKAQRAVGTAMRNNPFQIVVPCHRVLCSDGTIGGYSGRAKINVKEWLLKHEGIALT